MTDPGEVSAYHQAACKKALALYVEEMTTPRAAEDWYAAQLLARKKVAATLRATRFLADVEAGLLQSGEHVTVIRHLLAPPMSQDQFALLCPLYPKRSEKSGSPLSGQAAAAVVSAFNDGRDRKLTRWLDTAHAPSHAQVRNLLRSVVPMLSQQLAATLRRTRMSAAQEGAVIEMLQNKGWTRQSSALIDTLSDVPVGHFMHKTRFATKTRPQEVDIACGLGKTVVLAMECKVTNDETNSVKRINDVLKKAKGWQDHWGSFVRTAALLQGVIAFKEVERLLEANVIVFWSHDLAAFDSWLTANAAQDIPIPRKPD